MGITIHQYLSFKYAGITLHLTSIVESKVCGNCNTPIVESKVCGNCNTPKVESKVCGYCNTPIVESKVCGNYNAPIFETSACGYKDWLGEDSNGKQCSFGGVSMTAETDQPRSLI